MKMLGDSCLIESRYPKSTLRLLFVTSELNALQHVLDTSSRIERKEKKARRTRVRCASSPNNAR